MDIQNANSILLLAALLFVVGLVGLFALNRSSKHAVCVKNSNGAFIAGDENKNISVHINQAQNNTAVTPAWKKAIAFISWLATLAGPVIAALAYWFPRAGA